MRKTQKKLDRFVDHLEKKYQEKLQAPDNTSFGKSLRDTWKIVTGQEDEIDKIARQIADFSGYKYRKHV